MTAARPGAVVVGTGFGVLTHRRALEAAGFEVKALVGRDPERTQKRAARVGIGLGTTSLAEALALPGVEVVTVATPPHTHAPLVLEAVAAGKHVVCEKPFARDAAEAARMLEAAEKAGVVHLLGTEFRWATGQALATRAVRDGAIGEPRLATFLLHMPALADPAAEVPAWWGRREEGGGWLGAFASHLIDQILVTFGPISGVSASLSLLSARDWSAEDTFSIHFRTQSGVDGILQSTSGAFGPPLFATRFVGSQGTLLIEGTKVVVADAKGQRTLDVPADLELPPPVPVEPDLLVTAYDGLHAAGIDLPPYTKLFEVLRAKLEGRPVPDDPRPPTFADGVAVQKVLDAVRRASDEHVWVPIG